MTLNILFSNDVHFEFKLRNTSIAERWAGQLVKAQELGYTIDDPNRFYGFNSVKEEQAKALNLINHSIDVINRYRRIIDRTLTDVHDQDTLNYLHHIFEVYHGLLDTQLTTTFFASAPAEVQKSLADLNIHVHRCESVARGALPRCVVTYYGLPKTEQFDLVDYLHFTNQYTFGTVYINYVEIGKTIEDLAKDNDLYIADEAFRPYRNFSADFNIKFFNTDANDAISTLDLVDAYYTTNQDWFKERGLLRNNHLLSVGQLPIADLTTNLADNAVVQLISNNQHISRVWVE